MTSATSNLVACLRFVLSRFLEACAHEGQAFTRSEISIQFTPLPNFFGSGAHMEVAVPDFARGVGACWHLLATAHQYKVLEDLIVADSDCDRFLLYNDLTPVRPQEEQRRYLWGLICYLADVFFRRVGGYSWSDEVFAAMAHDMKSAFDSDTLPCTRSYLVANCVVQEPIEINSEMVLRPLDDKELSTFVLPGAVHPYLHPPMALRVQAVIEQQTAFRKMPAWHEVTTVKEDVDRVQSLLCLFLDSEATFVPALVCRWPEVYRLSPFVFETQMLARSLGDGPAAATLTARPLIGRLWAALSNMVDDHFLERPLRRLRLAYDDRDQTDRLLDCWIGIESLFMYGDKSMDALRLRLALRIGELLGKTIEEKKRRAKEAYELYDLRSRAVHSDATVSNDHLLASRAILRESILRLLESQETFNPWALDSELLKHVKKEN